ncbi:hypothetical protein E4665_08105 [Sporolactobacillus shoreae]|uniref:Glycosyltransferase RgtA/B/C/D-like domain-containing protein n=1 Tax=Sporolactobacillus shoreae TaxID=1465501 RepID=A0A4Z0GN00_9BACL|nr:hypothetical protein [Sporolactobacillus shoreae]TGA98475.1 hypothetical protein E4665_08105 [Sporolactobacillus shoreae]
MSKFFNQAIVITFLAILGFILILNIFFTRGYESIGESASFIFKIVTLLLSGLTILMLYKARRRVIHFTEKLPAGRATALLLTFSVGLQVAAVFLFVVHPSWDFGVVVRSARLLSEGGHIDPYFENYPNNLLIVVILALIGKLIFPSLAVYVALNIFVITLSEFLIGRITARLLGKPAGILSLLASVLFFPYIFYAPIVYTDTLSLFFILLPLALFIRKDGGLREDFHILFVVSVILALGVLLKGLMIVFVIAFSLTMFLFFRKWKKVYFFLPIIIFLLVQSIFNFCIFGSGIANRQLTGQFKFPVTHWLLMGQNQPHYGKYLLSDVLHTQQLLETHSRGEVSQIELGELRKRISEKGWLGNVRFLIEKNAETWSDGTYYALNVLKRKPAVPDHFDALAHHPLGWLTQGYARVQLLVLLAGILLAAIPYLRRQPSAFVIFSMLALIGFFLFLNIWETRSRYLVSLTPVLIILSTMGYFGRHADN